MILDVQGAREVTAARMNGFFVSVTRLRLRSWRYFPFFLVQAIRPARQAKSAEGVLSLSVLRKVRNTFWTRTMDGQSHEALYAFWTPWASDETFDGMVRRGRAGPLDSAVARTASWEAAHRRLQESGRLSKVNHPSETRRKNQFPPPRIQSRRELRFK
jgi:hypothetical protein